MPGVVPRAVRTLRRSILFNQSPPPLRRKNNKVRCLAPAVGILAVVIVLALALVYALDLTPSAFSFKGPTSCFTEDCQYHAAVLMSRLNVSVDPCEDFNAYVCSAWLFGPNDHSYATVAVSHAIAAWQRDLRFALDTLAEQQVPGAKEVLALFHACMQDVSGEESRKGIDYLKRVMRELRIPWLEAPMRGVEPLGVLFDLAFNYDLPFLFHVRIHREADKRTVVLSDGGFLPWWSAVKREVLSSDAFEIYWRGFYRAFAPNTTLPPSSDVQKVASVDTFVYNVLLRVTNATNHLPFSFALGDVQQYTASLSALHWKAQLNENVRSYGKFLLSDTVTVTEKSLIEAVGYIFANCSREELLLHLSWMFVQVFTPLADRELLLLKYGERRLAKRKREEFCTTQIENISHWLVSSLYLAARFNAERRAVIDEQVDNVKQVATAKIASLSWAADLFKRKAVDKLRNLTTVLWPPYDLTTQQGSSMLYSGGFFKEGRSFVESWIAALKHWRNVRTVPEFGDSTEEPRNYVAPLISYAPAWNTIRMSAASLSRPAFYADGTTAMVYGSLGFSYARELVKAFDTAGLAFDATGRMTDGTVFNEWQEVLREKAKSCRHVASSRSGRADTMFPEIPALEVAHAAFKAALGHREDVMVKVVDLHNERRLFFVTACAAMCSTERTLESMRLDCNKAMANFHPFAEAFGCDKNSRMSVNTECTFFT